MCAIAIQNRYVVTSSRCELKRGQKFSIKRGPIRNGQLVLARVGRFHVLARFYADVAGCDFLIQPSRWIRISNPADVQLLGAVV